MMKYKRKQDSLLEVKNLGENRFDMGGLAAVGTQMISDITAGIKGDEQKELGRQAREAANNAQMGAQSKDDSFDSIIADAANRQSLEHVSSQDMGGGTVGGGITDFLAKSGQGAAAGASMGPWGALAGAIAGGIGSMTKSIGAKIHADKEKKKTNAAIDYTEDFNDRTMDMRAENIQKQKMANLEANFAAFGGPFSTHGGFFSNGLQYINNGGRHEANPYDGVPVSFDPQGNPNLVEEGETIFNDYVFSNRLKVPKPFIKKYKLGNKPLTFAEVSKKLAKESEERPNDPISNAGLKRFMEDLSMAQEELRAKRGARRNNKYAIGGGVISGELMGSSYSPMKAAMIDWKEKGKENFNNTNAQGIAEGIGGAFSGLKGLSEQLNKPKTNYLSRMQEVAQSVNPTEEDTENRFSDGGPFDSELYENPFSFPDAPAVVYPRTTPNRRTARLNRRNGRHYADNILSGNSPIITIEGSQDYNIPQITSLPLNNSQLQPKSRWLEKGEKPLPSTDQILEDIRKVVDIPQTAPSTTYTQVEEEPDDSDIIKTDNSGDNIRKTPEEWAYEGMRYANGLGSLAQMLRNIGDRRNKVKDYTPKTISANPIGNYLTYKPTDTLYMSNLLGQQAGATRRAIQASGMSQGAIAASLLAADNNYLNQLGNAYRQAEEANLARKAQIEEFNRGTNMFNSRSQMEADMANQRADLYGAQLNQQAEQMREERRREYYDNYAQSLTDFMSTISNIGKDNMNRIISEDFADARTTNYHRTRNQRRANYWKNKGSK